MIFLQLFYNFFVIGLFGIGGGYGMLSLIQGEVVHHWHWMTTAEFTNIVAISQMTPGPIGINSATYCGYTAVHNAGMGNASPSTKSDVLCSERIPRLLPLRGMDSGSLENGTLFLVPGNHHCSHQRQNI